MQFTRQQALYCCVDMIHNLNNGNNPAVHPYPHKQYNDISFPAGRAGRNADMIFLLSIAPLLSFWDRTGAILTPARHTPAVKKFGFDFNQKFEQGVVKAKKVILC